MGVLITVKVKTALRAAGQLHTHKCRGTYSASTAWTINTSHGIAARGPPAKQEAESYSQEADGCRRRTDPAEETSYCEKVKGFDDIHLHVLRIYVYLSSFIPDLVVDEVRCR